MTKLLSRFTAMCMIAFCIMQACPPVSCAKVPDKTIVSFSSDEVIYSLIDLKNTLSVLYEASEKYPVTAKADITMGDGKDLWKTDLDGLDASDYNYLNMRVYSPSEQPYWIRVPVYDTNGVYHLYAFEANFEGWKTIALDLNNPKGGKNPSFLKSSLNSMSLLPAGWTNLFPEWGVNHYLYFEDVWLSESIPPEAIERDKTIDEYGNKTLAEFDSANAISTVKAAKPSMSLEASVENTRLYDVTGKCAINVDAPTSLLNLTNLELDLTGYAYLNAWVYSPKATSSVIRIPIYDTNGKYMLYSFTANFEGWKMVSVDLSQPVYPLAVYDKTKIASINFEFGGWVEDLTPWEESTFICFDKIWLSPGKTDDFKLVGAGYPQHCDSVPAYKPELELMMTNKISEETRFEAELYEDGELVQKDIAATFDGKTVKVKINDELLPDTDYELTIAMRDTFGNDVKEGTYRFKTEKSTLGISIPAITNASGEEIEKSFDGTVNVSVNKCVSGKLLAVVVTHSDGSNKLYTQELSETSSISNIRIAASDTLNAVVLDAETLVPESDGYRTVYGKDAEQEKEYFTEKATNTYGAELTKTTVVGTNITVAGNIKGDTGFAVLLLKAKTGGLTQAWIIDTVGKESFEKTFKIDDSLLECGNYVVSLTAFGSKADEGEEFYYLKKEVSREIYPKINQAQSADDVKEAIGVHTDALQLTGKSQNDIDNACLIIFEQKPYNNFDNVVETAIKAEKTLNELNECNWTTLSAFLKKNSDYVLGDMPQIAYYNSLSDIGKNTIASEIYKLKSNFGSFGEFRELFAEVTDKYKNGDYEKEEGTAPDKKSHVSVGRTGGGGGTSGSVVGNNSAASTNSQNENAVPFNDIDSVQWAKPYITALYQKGIISASQSYRPNDSVKREELLKMILEVFKTADSDKQTPFEDVDKSKWYASYVAAAYDMGIVSGISPTRFGIGSFVTRQDMAVMICRMAKYYGIALDENEKDLFADEASISDYARISVHALQNAKIVGGDENHCYNPGASLTRAEAAKVIECVSNMWCKEDNNQ